LRGFGREIEHGGLLCLAVLLRRRRAGVKRLSAEIRPRAAMLRRSDLPAQAALAQEGGPKQSRTLTMRRLLLAAACFALAACQPVTQSADASPEVVARWDHRAESEAWN